MWSAALIKVDQKLSDEDVAELVEQLPKRTTRNAKIVYGRRMLQFEYNRDVLSLNNIKESLASAGYRIRVNDFVDFAVKGMTCHACVNTLTKGLQLEDEIENAVVVLDPPVVRVWYDQSTVPMEDVLEFVEDVGFDARFLDYTSDALPTEEQRHKEVQRFLEEKREKQRALEVLAAKQGKKEFDRKSLELNDVSSPTNQQDTPYTMVVGEEARISVKGMTCASCVRAIETALQEHPFVFNASVNLSTKEARVSYDTMCAEDTDIAALISSLGYSATPIQAGTRRTADSMRADQEEESQLNRKRLFVSLIFSIPIFLLAMIFPHISEMKHHLMKKAINNLDWMSLLLWVLCTPVQFGVGYVFLRDAWKALSHGNANMSVLVSIGTLSAYMYSFISVISDLSESAEEEMSSDMSAAHFFETSSTLITFVLLGRLLEGLARGKTNEALATLMGLQADTAILVNVDEKTSEVKSSREVPVDELQLEDVVKVVRGNRIPCDGTIVDGHASIDESMITGESLPVDKALGDHVIGGTVSQEGTILVRCTACGTDSMLSQILKLMEDAQACKAPIQAYADKISSIFVPVVVIASLLSFAIWMTLVGTDNINADWYQDRDESKFLFAFLFGISVMVIACPCALGLATPTAVMVGTGVGAKLGILIKGGTAFETAHSVTAIVMDKTGTLTQGRPDVDTFTCFGSDGTIDETLTSFYVFLAGSAELSSEHVLGKALVRFATERNDCKELEEPKDFKAVNARGLQCTVDGHEVLIGSRQWLLDNQVVILKEADRCMFQAQSQGKVALCMAVNQKMAAIISLSDAIKPETRSVVAWLEANNVQVWMCTGDNRRTANVMAKKLGITRVKSEVLPADKLSLVAALQQRGHVVAMVGDGINDSPALAQADLGVAVSDGTDVAIETASVVLLRNNLKDLVCALDLSRATFGRIRANFMWALGYNMLGIPIAAGVLFPVMKQRLPPELAAFAMAMSSVSVVLSSLWLRRYTRPDIPHVRLNDASGMTDAELSYRNSDPRDISDPSDISLESSLRAKLLPQRSCCECSTCRCALVGQMKSRALRNATLLCKESKSSSCCDDQGYSCDCGCDSCSCSLSPLLTSPDSSIQ